MVAMVDLPKRKVGIVACSGEELAQGTVTRLAALRVLEQLHPAETVTICLPLFLAGGEGDRAFARFYPTIAVDGCDRLCAARATELFSSKPAASVVVDELAAQNGLTSIAGCRKLNQAGLRAVEMTAERVSTLVDELIKQAWNRRTGEFASIGPEPVRAKKSTSGQKTETCSCGSGIPVQTLTIKGEQITFIALPLLFQQFYEKGKSPEMISARELVEVVKIYNPIAPEMESCYSAALMQAYRDYYLSLESSR
jgi:hypothetical protein